MYTLLIQSISNLLKSKYSKGNRLHLRSVLGSLKQAAPLFLSDPSNIEPQQIIFRHIKPEDQIHRILDQFAQFMQRYYLKFDDSIGKILDDIEEMPKSRLTVLLGQNYRAILEKIFQHSIAALPQEVKIKKAKELLKKIINQKEDSEV